MINKEHNDEPDKQSQHSSREYQNRIALSVPSTHAYRSIISNPSDPQNPSHIRKGSFSSIPLPPKPLPSLPSSPSPGPNCQSTCRINDGSNDKQRIALEWELATEDEVLIGKRYDSLDACEDNGKRESQGYQGEKSLFHIFWIWYCYFVTWYLPTCLLIRFTKWFDNDRRVIFAWREKIALCSIIICISMAFAFIAFALSDLICDPKSRIGMHQIPNNSLIIYGNVYDASPSSSLWKESALQSIINIAPSIYGQSINQFFHDSSSSTCPLHTNSGIINPGLLQYPIQIRDVLSTDTSSFVLQAYLGQISIPWSKIDGNDQVFVYNGRVYTFDPSLLGPIQYTSWVMALNETITRKFPFILGKDATKDILALRERDGLYDYLSCFHPSLIIAYADTSQPGCVISQIISGTFLIVLVAMIMIKFVAAIVFNWILGRKIGKIQKTPPFTTKTPPFVMAMMTCYSEGKESLKATLDSIVATIYPDDRKLLIVVADGLVKGVGNDQSTPEILQSLIDDSFDWRSDNINDMNITSYNYESLSGANEAKVVTGLYRFEGRYVPILLVIKCGTITENSSAVKPGNRGKRDSQLIIMKFFSRLTMMQQDSHIIKQFSPLDHALLKAFLFILNGSTYEPHHLEYILMVDADTRLEYDSLNRLMAAMIRDQSLMGCCGETKIFNKYSSWVTKIQVFEYYIGHHLNKGFESVFGGVTCLPGCFSLYRLKSSTAHQYDKLWYRGYYGATSKLSYHGKRRDSRHESARVQPCYPLLVHSEIVERYGECIDDSNHYVSIHRRNLLHLGEDRYLTTLMLSQFPKRKFIFVPNAICRTIVPDKFLVLLSQRRRWINSTIHNLMELLTVKGLCGTFCCSMQFVVLLELLGAVLLPACVIFTYYLLFRLIIFNDDRVILSLLLTASMLMLQVALIMLTSCKWSYLKWMFYYILAIPIWNLVFPCYAFWHFDDFSWGQTRKIE